MAAVPKRLTRVLLADEYTLARQGAAFLLSRHPALAVVGQVHSAEAVSASKKLRPDVVIIELGRSERQAKEALGRLLDVEPRPIVIVLTRFANEHVARALLKMGADAYVSKAATAEALLRALSDALRGKKALLLGVAEARQGVADNRPTERELEILTLAAQGRSNRQIAEALYISEATVKRHLANLYTKMKVRSRGAAVRKSLSEGWIAEQDISGRP